MKFIFLIILGFIWNIFKKQSPILFQTERIQSFSEGRQVKKDVEFCEPSNNGAVRCSIQASILITSIHSQLIVIHYGGRRPADELHFIDRLQRLPTRDNFGHGELASELLTMGR